MKGFSILFGLCLFGAYNAAHAQTHVSPNYFPNHTKNGPRQPTNVFYNPLITTVSPRPNGMGYKSSGNSHYGLYGPSSTKSPTSRRHQVRHTDADNPLLYPQLQTYNRTSPSNQINSLPTNRLSQPASLSRPASLNATPGTSAPVTGHPNPTYPTSTYPLSLKPSSGSK